jgi:hypothetical protein
MSKTSHTFGLSSISVRERFISLSSKKCTGFELFHSREIKEAFRVKIGCADLKECEMVTGGRGREITWVMDLRTMHLGTPVATRDPGLIRRARTMLLSCGVSSVPLHEMQSRNLTRTCEHPIKLINLFLFALCW